MAYDIAIDVQKVKKCISSSQTPEHMDSCITLIGNLVRKYRNYPENFKSEMLYPRTANMNILISQKLNIWK